MAIKISIDALLESYAVDTLVEIADCTGVAPRQKKRPTKVELVRVLKEGLFAPARVHASYAALNAADRQVLDFLLFRGGEIDKSRLERELLRGRLVTPLDKADNKRYGEAPLYAASERTANATNQSRALQDVLARLTRHGLVFSVNSIYDYGNYTYKLGLHPSAVIFVPAAVRTHLPKVTVSPIAASAEWKPERTVHETPYILLRDMFLYWDYVRRVEPPLLRGGLIGKRTLRAINELLIVPDPAVETANDESGAEKLRLLRGELATLQLIGPHDLKLVAKTGEAGALPAFWTLDTPQQIAVLLRQWLGEQPQKPAPRSAYDWAPATQAANRALLKELLSAGDEWLDLALLTDRARERDRAFLFPALTNLTNARYINTYFNGRYFSDYTQLLDVVETEEERFALAFGNGKLFQLGLLEHGFLRSSDTEWRLLRLTEGGRLAAAAALDEQPKAASRRVAETGAAYAADDQGRVIVQPNFQVLALGPVRTHILARLQLCANRVKADAHVFEYTLTRESIYQAQQADFPVDVVIGFLAAVSGAPLPQNVLRSLEEWGAHHERIVFRTGVSVLQAVEPELLVRLMADPGAGAYLARIVTPAVALVKPGADADLIAALFAQATLPAIADTDPNHTDNDVTIDPEGVITPVHAVPSLFLTGRVARIAEQDAHGVWRLTPDSVKRRGSGRAAVLATLEELGRLHRGTLPPAIVSEVKRWGGYYGQAAIATVTLLEFESKAHLADLLAQPALQALLTPFAAGERALAVAPTERLADVERVLTELGVGFSRGLSATR